MRSTGSRSSEINAGAVRRLLQLVQILEHHPEGLGVQELMARMQASRRTIYRDLRLLEDNGFSVSQPARGRYALNTSRTEEYSVQFSEAEARLLFRALDAMDSDSILRDSLIRKLRPLGGLATWLPEPQFPHLSKFLGITEQAIAMQQQLLIQSYSSSRSGKVTDRVVEPFAILEHGTFIRAFDVGHGENRTFRLSRMGGLVMMEQSWKYRRYHEKDPEPDMFGFTGDAWYPVRLEVRGRFVQLLREEYPGAEIQAFRTGSDTWDVELKVKSWTGIGRFCMGLLENVIRVHSVPFQVYLKQKIAGPHNFLNIVP